MPRPPTRAATLAWVCLALSACGGGDSRSDGGATDGGATAMRRSPGAACTIPRECAPNPELLCGLCAEVSGEWMCAYACGNDAHCPDGQTCHRLEGSYDAQGCIDHGVEAPGHCR